MVVETLFTLQTSIALPIYFLSFPKNKDHIIRFTNFIIFLSMSYIQTSVENLVKLNVDIHWSFLLKIHHDLLNYIVDELFIF